jgi:hypothetical protein
MIRNFSEGWKLLATDTSIQNTKVQRTHVETACILVRISSMKSCIYRCKLNISHFICHSLSKFKDNCPDYNIQFIELITQITIDQRLYHTRLFNQYILFRPERVLKICCPLLLLFLFLLRSYKFTWFLFWFRLIHLENPGNYHLITRGDSAEMRNKIGLQSISKYVQTGSFTHSLPMCAGSYKVLSLS